MRDTTAARSSIGKGVVFALAMAAWTPAAWFVSALLTTSWFLPASVESTRGVTVAGWALLVLLATPAFVWLGRRRLGDGAPLAVGMGLLGLAPTMFFAAAWSWGDPIVFAGWRCGTGDIGLVMIGLPMSAGLSFVGALVGIGVARGKLPRPPGLTVFAVLAVLGAGGLVVVAAPRMSRPAAEDWVESVPVVTTVPADVSELDVTQLVRVDPHVALERTCTRNEAAWGMDESCHVRMRVLGEAGEVGERVNGVTPCDDDSLDCGLAHELGSGARALIVRRDAAHALWLVENADGGSTRAFDDLVPTAVEPMMVSDAIAPPLPWLVLGLLGLFGALTALGARLRVGRELRAWSRARAGRVDDGDVVFDDGDLPRRGALVAPAPTGPALALPSAPAGAPGYRDDGSRGTWRVASGSRGEVLGRIRLRVAGWSAIALALAVVSMVPLLVALR